MPVFKCKMCGGQLNIVGDERVVECEYCGSSQSLPSFDNEKKIALFNRANNLRFNQQFDKAAGIYESIVAEFPDEAEAYWGLCLCKYGIEYVDDPHTKKKIPTCHRTCTTSILDDNDYQLAYENADLSAQIVCREEAKLIDSIQKKIHQVIAKEEPYDIFICYKETDEVTRMRTEDSGIAQDIYTELVKDGYKVFFSRVTLRDKAGAEYEPYIYSALSSAKVMLAIGTRFEYYEAVWVRNEWSRYLNMMKDDPQKQFIACYKNIEPSVDFPKEFGNLQALNMGDVTFFKNLLTNVRNAIPKKSEPEVMQVPVSVTATDPELLLRRAMDYLEDRQWKSAQEFCNKILDIDPMNAMAYVLHLARVMRVTDFNNLGSSVTVLSTSKYFDKALQYADDGLKAKLNSWNSQSEENVNRIFSECQALRERGRKARYMISTGKNHTVGVRTDGTMLSCGSNEKGQCNVSSWRNIVAVSCGAEHTVGLRSDGTVVACGENGEGQCNVDGWRDIVMVAANTNHTVGLRSDGTVVACGNNDKGKCDVSEWTDIIEIGCGYHHSVGLRSDGTVVSTGSNKNEQCNTSEWKNIVSIFAANIQTVGVMKNGTVVSTCTDEEIAHKNVKNWSNIAYVVGGTHHTIGFMTDGSCVFCGTDGQERSSGTKKFKNIAAVVGGYWNTIGILSDGTLLYTGDTDNGKNEIGGWRLFNSIDEISAEQNVFFGQRAAYDEQLRMNAIEKDFQDACILAKTDPATAAKVFERLGDYKNSAQLIGKCKEILNKRQELIPIDEALELLRNNKAEVEEKYNTNKAIFGSCKTVFTISVFVAIIWLIMGVGGFLAFYFGGQIADGGGQYASLAYKLSEIGAVTLKIALGALGLVIVIGFIKGLIEGDGLLTSVILGIVGAVTSFFKLISYCFGDYFLFKRLYRDSKWRYDGLMEKLPAKEAERQQIEDEIAVICTAFDNN